MAIYGEIPILLIGCLDGQVTVADNYAHTGFPGNVFPTGTTAISLTARGGVVGIEKFGISGQADIAAGDTLWLRVAGQVTAEIYLDLAGGATCDVLAWA